MSEAVKVRILDKEYLVACPPSEEAALQESARHLNKKMTEIRKTGKVVGIDRIAVMAGLNIAHEALEGKPVGGSGGRDSSATRLKKLNAKIEKALSRHAADLQDQA